MLQTAGKSRNGLCFFIPSDQDRSALQPHRRRRATHTFALWPLTHEGTLLADGGALVNTTSNSALSWGLVCPT